MQAWPVFTYGTPVITGSPHEVSGKAVPEHADSTAELMLNQRSAPVIGPTQTPCVGSFGEPVAEIAVIVGGTVATGVGSPTGLRQRQQRMTHPEGQVTYDSDS